MPRWYQGAWKPGLQTCVMDSSKATVIDGASAEEEFDRQLRQLQHQLDQINKTEPDKRRRVVDVDANGKLYLRDYNKDLEG